jgi:hypothetical protein
MRMHHWGGPLAAVLILASTGAWAQSRGGAESAEQNVRESQQYEALLCSNPSFRAKRIAQECGPITDPQLHQSCLASFDCGGPKQAVHPRRTPPSEMIR